MEVDCPLEKVVDDLVSFTNNLLMDVGQEECEEIGESLHMLNDNCNEWPNILSIKRKSRGVKMQAVFFKTNWSYIWLLLFFSTLQNNWTSVWSRKATYEDWWEMIQLYAEEDEIFLLDKCLVEDNKFITICVTPWFQFT